jgi:hypothetical protein
VDCFLRLFPLVGVTLRAPLPPGDVVGGAGLRAEEEEVEAAGLAGATTATEGAGTGAPSGFSDATAPAGSCIKLLLKNQN